MDVRRTKLAGVLVVEPRVFSDARGFFLETFSEERYAGNGICGPFVQDNWSHSVQGTLRGLHYQIQQPQAKLVQVMQGTIFDVAVDLRRDSSGFGQWEAEVLSAENKKQFFIPPGFAHGFLVLSETADFVYKCSDYYAPEYDRTLLWNDESVGIAWPQMDNLILSDKDRNGVCLEQADCFPGTPESSARVLASQPIDNRENSSITESTT